MLCPPCFFFVCVFGSSLLCFVMICVSVMFLYACFVKGGGLGGCVGGGGVVGVCAL